MTYNNLFSKTNLAQLYRAILVIATLYFIKEILIVSQIEPIWKDFWDTNDYRLQSEADLFSWKFFSPSPKKWFSPRPFTMSLMYKLVDSDTYKMILFQKFLHCLSALTFILVLNKFISNYFIKTINALLLLFFFTWWNIVGWSNNAISESISISFMLLWFAAIMYYYQSYSTISVISLALLSVLFSFTRDNWAYILLLFFILNLIVHYKAARKKIIINLFLLIFFTCVFFIQNYTMKIGQRNVIPIYNSLAVRVSQNNEYLDWFSKQGMPDKELLSKTFKGVNIEIEEGKTSLWNTYEDSLYKNIFTWIKSKGKSTYQKFILSHPNYFFLQDQTQQQVDRIFAYNVKGYYRPCSGFFLIAESVFPIFNNYLFFFALLICIYIFYKTKEKFYLLPPALGILTIINAILVYNADTMEVRRHLFTTVICRELICFISIAIAFNYFLKTNTFLNWCNLLKNKLKPKLFFGFKNRLTKKN